MMRKIKYLVGALTVLGVVYVNGQVRNEKVGGVDMIIKSTEGCVDRCPVETPTFRPDRLDVYVPKRKRRTTESSREFKSLNDQEHAENLDTTDNE
ncbi:MAG: hypothetical protein QXL01_02560 [Thermoplasmatales archaeon]